MPEPFGTPEKALGIASRVEHERGQWTVYLDISFWNGESANDPIRVVRQRISTYPTQERALLAASLMVRAASRNQPHLPLAS